MQPPAAVSKSEIPMPKSSSQANWAKPCNGITISYDTFVGGREYIHGMVKVPGLEAKTYKFS